MVKRNENTGTKEVKQFDNASLETSIFLGFYTM